MGLDYVFSCGDTDHSVRFSDTEWAWIERLRTVAGVAVEVLFNASLFGEEVSLPAEELTAAADALLAVLRDRPDLQPATYQMRMERLPGSDQPDGTWQGGAISGLQLPGEPDFFMLRVGPDRCELERIRVGPDGRGQLMGAEDIRARTSIQTTTVGRIDFRRRPAGATLRKKLTALREFFVSHSGSRVSTMLC